MESSSFITVDRPRIGFHLEEHCLERLWLFKPGSKGKPRDGGGVLVTRHNVLASVRDLNV